MSAFADGSKIAALLRRLEATGDEPGIRQLQDLQAEGTDHTWLWIAASTSGFAIRQQEFRTAVRMRIGADVLDEEMPCACCGGVIDRRGLHCLRCAPGESTRGHNWVAGTLLGLASLSDASSLAEPRGLVPSRPGLRPADLLTTTAFGRGAALDVSIVSPDSEGAGSDACAATVKHKLAKYGPILRELDAEGFDYRPLVWTCWGRPDPEARVAVRTLACAAARRRGLGDPRVLERHASAIVGCFIWRRAAAMVHACVGWHAATDVQELLAPLEGSDDGDHETAGDAAAEAVAAPVAAA